MRIVLTNNLRLTDIAPHIYETLVEQLRFPNPKWLENARMGRWNGNTPKELRYYDKTRGGGLWIPRGYLRQLILLCKKDRIQFTIDDRRRELPAIPFKFTGTLKPYQKTAVDKMLSRDFGTLDAPTGSGKTVMALNMIAVRQQPTLVLVHTKDLAYQWIERVEMFLGIPAEEVGMIGGGRKKIGEKITIAMVQSLYKCADEVTEHIGHLIVDECHRTPSRTFTDAVTEIYSRYMLGLSATPWRRDKLSKLIFWHLGDVHYEIDKRELEKTGDILRPEVTFVKTDFRPYFDPVNEYSKMLSELTSDDDRNRLIASDISEIAGSNGVCLVLSDRKKHCENLVTLLKYRHGISAELLTGDLNDRQRKEVLDRLKAGRVSVLVATGQLIGEGFDYGELSTLFITTPVRFSGRVLQYIGRIMRPAPGKKHARIFDYVDVNVEVLKNAAAAREKVYER